MIVYIISTIQCTHQSFSLITRFSLNDWNGGRLKVLKFDTILVACEYLTEFLSHHHSIGDISWPSHFWPSHAMDTEYYMLHPWMPRVISSLWHHLYVLCLTVDIMWHIWLEFQCSIWIWPITRKFWSIHRSILLHNVRFWLWFSEP